MVDRSSSPPASLELLLHEIEATPREYWTDLLDTLRQFRQKISSTASPVIDAEQAQKNQAAIDLLDSWLDESESASEHQQAWEFLKIALEKIDYPIVHYSHEPSDFTGFWATGNGNQSQSQRYSP